MYADFSTSHRFELDQITANHLRKYTSTKHEVDIKSFILIF